MSQEIELGLVKVYHRRIQLPQDFRKMFDIKEGDKILFVKDGERVYVKKIEGRYIIYRSSHFPDVMRYSER